MTLRYAYGAAQPRRDPVDWCARWRAPRRPLDAASGAGRGGCRRPSLGRGRDWLVARAAVGRVHAALGHHLRGVRGPARDLSGRLLPVRRVRRPDRLPRPAPAHAAHDLRGARARSRRAAVLGRASSRPAACQSPTARSRCAARTRSCSLRTTWTCGCSGPRRSTGWPRATCACSAGGCRSAAAAWRHALAPPEAGVRPSGVAARARTAATARTLTGDWSDFSGAFLEMNESTLVSAQLAYVYPRLAELADARGDRAFARTLRRRGSELRASQRRQWAGRWFNAWLRRGADRSAQARSSASRSPGTSWRGCPTAPRRAGSWPPSRRFLTGVGAPAELGGPARIGSSMSPAAADPERHRAPGRAGHRRRERGVRGGRLVRDQRLAHVGAGGARRRGAAARARTRWTSSSATRSRRMRAAFPRALERRPVDRRCLQLLVRRGPRRLRHRARPHLRGADHAPARLDALRGHPAGGHRAHARAAIASDPRLPLRRFSLRLPNVGLEVRPGRVRGYVRPSAGGGLVVDVERPGAGPVRAWVDGRPARATVRRGLVRLRLRARAGRASDFAVVSR